MPICRATAAIEAVEFARARAEIARTGRADLLARAELVRCATRVASLVLEPCAGLRRTGAGRRAAGARLCPLSGGAGVGGRCGAVAAAASGRWRSRVPGARPSAALDDPLARLVAAGVLMRRGQADPQTIATAIDAASSQGWRRPLLAWLGVQA